MSGDSPPPKPKPGSLRDRIAAFEKKPEQNAPSPPAPRPKPGHVQWKPRHSSPPPAPVDAGDGSEGAHAGATDAKESIGAGGMSLKERMAALQGRGAFAPPPPAPVPKPVSERKWKPPAAPVPAVPSESEGEPEHHDDVSEATESHLEVTNEDNSPQEQPEHETTAEAAEDPDEEERQRRAAIAARLARLGGARIGMGPPVYAPKPRAPPPKESPPPAPIESADEAAGSTSDTAEAGAGTSETSLLSPESGSSTSGRSMPIPSGPRRAAPPRRRPPKSPVAGSGELPPLPSEEEGEKDKEAEASAEEAISPLKEEAPEEPPAEAEEETEEEAAARRKRIADRIAKSGGVNPFAGPRPAQADEKEHEEEEKADTAAVEDGTEVEEAKTQEKVAVVAQKLEEAEAEAEAEAEPEVPPRSPPVSDEPSAQEVVGSVESEDVAPPLPPKLTTDHVEEINTDSATKSPPVELPTKDEEPTVPVVDLSQPAQVSDALDDTGKGKDTIKSEAEEKHSVDITEAAGEYRDVRTVEDPDDRDADENIETKPAKKKKGKKARKSSQVLPGDK